MAVDESGRFEDMSCKKKIIGGVIYTGRDVDDENIRIKDFLSKVCAKYNFKYPDDLHMMYGRDEKYGLMEDAVKYMKDNGKYKFFYIIKSEGERKDYKNISNFIDENSVSNLYEHMISELICNMVFYNYKLIDEKDYNLNIATRVASVSDENEVDKYRRLGYSMKQDNGGKYRIYLSDNKVFKSVLSEKMMECRIKKNINLGLNVERIDYKSDGDMKSAFLYLADIACSAIMDSVNVSEGRFDIESSYKTLEKLMGTRPFIWVYDDIETLQRKMTEDFVSGSLFDVLCDLYNMENCSSGYKKYYLKHWAPDIKNNLASIADDSKIDIYISRLNYIISKKGDGDDDKSMDVEKAVFIGHRLLEIFKGYGAEMDYYRFKIADILLRCFNHKGDIDECYKVMEYADSLKAKLSLEDAIGWMIRKSEIYENAFDFEKALNERMRLKDAAEMLKENNNYIAADIIPEDVLRGEVQLGKIYSAIGQTYSFMGKYENGESYFEKALLEFKGDSRNESVTTSYLLHMAIDSGNRELYEKHAGDYLKGEGLKEELENILNDRDSFKLYVFVKALHRFYTEYPGYDDILNTLYSFNYEGKGFITNCHPWEMIFRRIGIMEYENGKQKEGQRMMEKSKKTINNPGITIELINKSSLLKGAQYEKNEKQSSRLLKNIDEILEKSEPVKKYFDDFLKENGFERKKEKFLKKFTYMYD